MPSSFIGIQIPPELRSEITSFCRERQYISTEPHIKLISPSLLGGTPILQQKLESFCLMQPEFKVVIAGPNCFNNQMLYLTVLPGAVNMVRDRLVKHLNVEQTVYRPHLTIMRQYAGSELDMDRYCEDARQIFTKPFTFEVSHITLFSRNADDEPYAPTTSVALSGR